MDTREDYWTTPHGAGVRMVHRPDTNDFGVITSILIHDEYGIPTGRSGLAVDVGAHIGAWAVGVALDNPDLHVIAIEPVPANAALLRQNIELNGIADRVQVLENAAGSRRGKMRISYRDDGDDVHRFIGNQRGVPGDAHLIGTVTLASLNADIDLMKLDCEGCEYAFLASPAIKRVRELVGEYHEYPPNLPTHDVTHSKTADRLGSFRAVRR